MLKAITIFAFVTASPAAAGPGSTIDVPMIARIIDEGLNHSQAAPIVEELTDDIGARPTNSPSMRRAEAWAKTRLAQAGLRDVRREGFEFGRGWAVDHADVAMTVPRSLQLHAVPIAWTPGTGGPITATTVLAPITSEADFATWRGRLRGRIVLVSNAEDPEDESRPSFYRIKDSDLAEHASYGAPAHAPAVRADRAARIRFAVTRDAFLAGEGARAWARMASNEDGLLGGEGYLYRVGGTPRLPGIELTREDYRRIARISTHRDVVLRIDTAVDYADSDTLAYNILADLPGSGIHARDYVMAGAHLDSWAAGDGATDDGFGVAVVIEAARILSALHIAPKRTIRFALWAGEEQGLLGSQAYVARHLASRAEGTTAVGSRSGGTGAITLHPGYGDLAAYFNLDNGAGRIRGIFAAGNVAAIPQLEAWLRPFASMGAATVLASANDGSDQESFTEVGVPAFQFVQDPLDYRFVHHTQLDTFDHLRPGDLRQAAVVLAGVLLQAANAEVPLPHTPVPIALTAPGNLHGH